MIDPSDDQHFRAALRDPGCYALHAGAGPAVEWIETHISFVALTGDLVFKLKKPVRLPFLDFSTRELRRAACRDEVRLNRRLCPTTYLGIAPLLRDGERLRMGPLVADVGDGEAETVRNDEVDCAVVMRRLPSDRMLDALLRQNAVTIADVEGLARTVAAFHQRADRSPQIDALGAPETLAQLASDNFTEIAGIPGHGLSTALLAATQRASERAFRHLLPRLIARGAEGHIVDGHGDLHARNVCMTTPPAIYDCLEFSPRLRCGDVANEVAFLAMDLRHRGAAELARAFVAAYVRESKDTEIPSLLPPLVSYRAMVRGKVAALAAADAALSPADRVRASNSASSRLLLAAMALAEADGPVWIALCGPPGSGKSTVAKVLRDATGAAWISTDVLRKRLFGAQPTERLPASCYSEDFTQRTYAATLQAARDATLEGTPSVVLDGNFATPQLRQAANAAARAARAQLVVMHIDVNPTVGLARVTARMADPARASDADPTLHEQLRARFVPPTAAEGLRVVRVDGGDTAVRVAAEGVACLMLPVVG